MRLYSLLKYLLAAKGHRVPDFQIQDDLWPDSDGDRATNAFRVALHRLRKLLGDPEAILRRSGNVSLNDRKCWTDVWAFEDIAGEAESLPKGSESAPQARNLAQRLLQLYQGPFLPGEEAFWAIHTRQTSTHRFVRLIELFTGILAQTGDHHSVVDILNRSIAAEPFEETLYFILMKTLHRMGEPYKAIRLYERYQENLSTRFGVSPSERIMRLCEKIKRER
ncbi:MAG: AfsR/SARP family transcriptional regulator [Thermodesulfobacteriota bacterium]